jgi:hypothetical protein
MILVIGIISALITFVNIPGILTTSRRVTALQEIASTLDLARSRALRGNVTVYVAFSPWSESGPLQPCRQYALFEESDTTNSAIQQISEWRRLPEGVIIHPTATANRTPGNWTNLFTLPAAIKSLPLIDRETFINAPVLGFGSLGELIHPDDEVPAPFAIVLAEGEIRGSSLHVPNPASSLCLEVRRNGKTLIISGSTPPP